MKCSNNRVLSIFIVHILFVYCTVFPDYWEYRRLEAVSKCLNNTLAEEGIPDVISRCYSDGDIPCYGVKLGHGCASGYNAAFNQHPTPQMLKSPAGIFYSETSRVISVSVAVRPEDDAKVKNVLGFSVHISFRRPSTPFYIPEDGSVSFHCILESPLTRLKNLFLSYAAHQLKKAQKLMKRQLQKFRPIFCLRTQVAVRLNLGVLC